MFFMAYKFKTKCKFSIFISMNLNEIREKIFKNNFKSIILDEIWILIHLIKNFFFNLLTIGINLLC